jgi:hypothetical protein
VIVVTFPITSRVNVVVWLSGSVIEVSWLKVDS